MTIVIDIFKRLGMVGAKHLLSPGAFMACVVTYSPLNR